MSVKIRLTRAGAKKAPFYRIVATDSRMPRDGRFLEILGRYNPRVDPSFIELDVEKTEAWISKGAQMSERVSKIYEIAKNPDAASAPKPPSAPSKKAQAKEAAAEEEAAAAKVAKKEAAKAAKEEAAAAKEAPAEAEEAPAEEAPAEEAPESEEAPAEEEASEEAPESEEASD